MQVIINHLIEVIGYFKNHINDLLLFTPLLLLIIPIISKFSIVPTKIQALLELIYEFLEEQIKSMFKDKKDYKAWMPFFLTIFFYILILNLVGLIPGIHSFTGELSFTATLAILVILVSIGAGIKRNGVVKYFVNLTPSGISPVIRVLMFPLEITSLLAKPFSLSLRLYANMFAGHTVIKILLSLTEIFQSKLILPFDIVIVSVMMMFEIFVSLIQAFIFAYLAAVYVSDSLYQESH